MASSFAKVKTQFFGKDALDEADRMLQKGLSKLGAFIRRTAQTSMKTRSGASPPGMPPHSHGNKYLKKYYFFVYDRKNKSMIVGPAKLNRTASFDVPRVQEKGEVRTIHSKRTGKSIVKRFPARPYTAPAVKENLDKLPQIFSLNRATRSNTR